jgi:hypothetical protein
VSIAEHTAWSRQVTPYLLVEVDDEGVVRVAVRSGTTRLDSRVDNDGYARADVSNVAELSDVLSDAQLLAMAVFPPGRPEFHWRQRRDAYLALTGEHKITLLRPHLARDVTLFLRDWMAAEVMADVGHREHTTIEEYAKEWEKWW